MDDEMMEFGGFSLAKIVLSNALPSCLYYPDPPKVPRLAEEEDGEEEKSPE